MPELPFELNKHEFLIKREYESSGKYGVKPQDRPLSEKINYGILNIDKPSGPTSHQVSGYVKEILGLPKAGHSGTLDPQVTGVLPVGLNKATRVMQWLLTAGKEYVCLMHIHSDIPQDTIHEAVQRYTGKIMQLPPIKSAVRRQVRERNIYYVKIIDIDGREVLFSMGCQAGTYVRKWVHDFGLTLGTQAHMVELRRTKAGPFNEDSLTSLVDLKDAYYYYKEENNPEMLEKILMTPEYAVSHIKKIYVMDSAVSSLCHGAFLKIPGIVKIEKNISKDDIVALFTLKEELILVGKALMSAQDIMKSEKGIVLKTEQVFMEANLYPKFVE